jgi:hypothetical protein
MLTKTEITTTKEPFNTKIIERRGKLNDVYRTLFEIIMSKEHNDGNYSKNLIHLEEINIPEEVKDFLLRSIILEYDNGVKNIYNICVFDIDNEEFKEICSEKLKELLTESYSKGEM